MLSLVAVGIPGFIISFRSGLHVRMRMPRFDLLLKGFGGSGEYHLSLRWVSAGGVACSGFRCCHPRLLFPLLYVIFLYLTSCVTNWFGLVIVLILCTRGNWISGTALDVT